MRRGGEEYQNRSEAVAPEPGELLDEVMFYGVAGGSTTRIDLQLIEDGSHMGADRRQANRESFGDLGIGQPFRQ